VLLRKRRESNPVPDSTPSYRLAGDCITVLPRFHSRAVTTVVTYVSVETRIRTWVSRGNGCTDRRIQPLCHLDKFFLGRSHFESYVSAEGRTRTCEPEGLDLQSSVFAAPPPQQDL